MRSRDGFSFSVLDYKIAERLPAGKHYLYCKVSTVARDEYAVGDPALDKTSVLTAILEITITPREKLDGFEGRGLPDDPYLVNNADQLKLIAEAVDNGDRLSGVWFQFENNITLPLDWDPIGKLILVLDEEEQPKRDVGSIPFLGFIDGAGYTLTIPEGGKPLLEFVREAVVKNLNIYGSRIEGAGLLDFVGLDYGDDENYDTGVPDIITIENVTLKSGSSTKRSGLVNSGYYSGKNNVFIRNCTIEEDVVIGYSKDQSLIGSFAGTLNGRIDNCVSYATVYGVDSIGGLAGDKGQSMGLCDITNSAFLGEIRATGECVGGILARGYISGSAPNTMPVTIRNCYVAADITGASRVGGILGDEGGVQSAMNSAYITDNFFYGTITANDYAHVGGIIGRLGSYNQGYIADNQQLQFYENNYYYEESGSVDRGLGSLSVAYPAGNPPWNSETDSFVAKSADDFANGTVLDLLNEGTHSFVNWMQEDGAQYPVHDPNAGVVVTDLIISGNYKIVYYVGEELDTTGMKFTARKSDGSETEVTVGDVGFSAYDPDAVGNQNITATYAGASVVFTVSVIRNYDTGGPQDDTIFVKFALIGSTRSNDDVDLGNEALLYRGASYETWIGLSKYEMAEGATVLELFDRALKQAKIPYTIKAMNNYVDSINGLSEGTNGSRSGWMYTVGKKDNGSDGLHPDLGLREYVLNDGDVIIWHYVNDYSYEVHDWFEEPGYPSLGQDGKYYSLWLKALASGSYTPPSGSGSYTPPSGSGGITDSGTVLAPKVTASNGMATATVTASDMTSAIDEAKTNGSDFIVIAPEITGAAKKVSVELPKASVSSVASDTDADLKIETSVGNVTIPNDVLASVVSQASGDTISIMVESVEIKTLTAEQQKLVGDGAVFDISILSGGKPIRSFGDKSITIALPYTLKSGETAVGVTVWYLSDDGKLERMTCTYDAKTGLATFTTNHLSHYVVGYDAWQNPFTDVKEDNWFYDAVKYAVQNELFNGTSATTFSPNTDMTRAMLVTVLYRLEGMPAVSGANTFTDVKDGQWYTDAVIWASSNGIVGGYGNDLFGTDDPITREQMATMLLRYAEYKNYDTAKANDLAGFTDSGSIASYALDAMKWANAEGLIRGRTSTTLAPAGTATRAEVATILMRFAENVVK